MVLHYNATCHWLGAYTERSLCAAWAWKQFVWIQGFKKYNFQTSNLKSIIFKLIIQNSSLCTHCEILRGECHRTLLMTSNIDIGNGLVPSGNKALHKLMVIQIFVAIWHHYATMSQEIDADFIIRDEKQLMFWAHKGTGKKRKFDFIHSSHLIIHMRLIFHEQCQHFVQKHNKDIIKSPQYRPSVWKSHFISLHNRLVILSWLSNCLSLWFFWLLTNTLVIYLSITFAALKNLPWFCSISDPVG